MQRDLSQIRAIKQAQSWYLSQQRNVFLHQFPEIRERYKKSEDNLWIVLNSYSGGSTLSDEDVARVIKNSLKMKNLITLLKQRLVQKNKPLDQKNSDLKVAHFAIITAILFLIISLALLSLYHAKLRKLKREIVTALSPESQDEHYQTLLGNTATEIDTLQRESQRLEFIQKRFQRMFNALPLGVVACDLSGIILVSNRLFADTFWKGTSPVGELFETVMSHIGFSEQTRGKIRWKERDWWISEYRIETGNYLVFQDVTDQEKMATKLLNSERLISIGEMASRITHEIRNPLSTIKMNSEYMREHAYEMTAEEIESTFKPVINEIVRLEQITDKYINMVKYRSTVEAVSAVIPDDLAELISFHRPEMEARNIEIEVTLPETPVTLEIPVDAFREVILNIMKNGWEEIEKDGKMHIRVVLVDNKLIEIHIEDSGNGVADEIKDQIFETFFTGKAGGTGIGLSHTKTLVTENRGSITVSTSSLGGADFTVSLPCEKGISL